jgi:hypothetical protein
MITLQNEGYKSSSISYNIPDEYQHIGLWVNFTNGVNIGANSPKLIVEISFISKEPINFTMKVEFMDQ